MHQPIPSVPKIDDPRLYMDVHTHKSVRVAMNDEYGDNERLAILGEKVFSLAVTNALFSEKPMLAAGSLEAKVAEHTSSQQIEKWVDLYKLKAPLVYTQESTEVVKSTKETCFFFHSYLGAIFIRAGIVPIQHWVARLINPESEPSTPQGLGSPPSPYAGLGISPWGPTQPLSPPPPLPSSSTNKGTPSGGILAIFNQTAAQRGITVTYAAEKSGPPHAPLWVVQCNVDNVPRGVGQGKNQKLAKEEAAKQAWAAMGWGSA